MMNSAGQSNETFKAVPSLGIFTRLTDPSAYETLAVAGIRLIVIDLEHGSFSRETLSLCTFAARSAGIRVLARMTSDGLPAIQHAHGIGIDGVIVPHCDVAGIERVARFVRTELPLLSYAGATRRSARRTIPWDEFRLAAQESFMLLAQVDSDESLKASGDLISIHGVDGLFVGTISLDLQDHDDLTREALECTLGAVAQQCRAAKKVLAVSAPDLRAVHKWRERGASMFFMNSDHGLLLRGVQQLQANFDSTLAGSVEKPADD